MAETKLNETFSQIKQLIIEMPLMKKVSILMTVAIAVGALVFLAQLSGKSRYEVLFSKLEAQDMSAIAAALDKYGVTYQIQSTTQSVLVPGSDVLQTRLKLARDGLPQFGGVGFEIFDTKSFGMTDFEQRLNYQRALQGELQRTINEFKEIDDSRVHLVIPEKNLFMQAKDGATASVILKLATGQKVNEETVRSIVHLVSSSVPNLNSRDVTVVDTNGNLLTAETGDENVAGGGGGAGAFRKKRDIEVGYEQKVLSLLEPIIGFGKVKVRVTADLDFTAKETTEEKYDPESIAVRTESRTKNKETENKGGSTEGSNNGNKDSDQQNESVTYEVSKQMQKIIHPTGDVKTLSVAVIVDGKYTKNEDGTSTYVARTPDEIKSFEDVVKSAIGFSDKRGDQLKVMNLAFQNPEELFAKDQGSGFEKLSNYTFYVSIVVNVVIAVIALLIIFFVVRPLIVAWSSGRNKSMEALAGGTQNVLTTGQARSDLAQKALSDPADMVNVLRKWLE